jgi:UDP-2-acetamido-3-amino-2,3-dideoxy-glucuronate N-acetyltransferase
MERARAADESRQVLARQPLWFAGGTRAEGMRMTGDDGYFAHESAYVDQGAQIGAGTKIWHFCHVMGGAKIGERCSLGQNVFVANATSIGDGAKIQNNVSIYEGVHLDRDVFCGPSMVFTNVVNPRSHVSRKAEYRATHVGRGATLGANCTIVCGHTIGRFAFVGAGAVITRDLPDFALALGVPGRVVGYVCQCGVRLALAPKAPARDLACAACGWKYRWDGRSLVEVA